MQIPCTTAPIEIHVAHRHAMLAAGIGAILGPHALVFDGPLALWQQPSQVRQARLLVTDLDKAMQLRSGGLSEVDWGSILVVEGELNPQKVQSVLRAGVQACVSADGPPNELHLAIRALSAGRRYFCPLASSHFGDALVQPSLTERETDVLELLCIGLDDKTIAAQLRIAPGTVKCHVKSILAKTGKRSRTAVAAQALCHGWVSKGARIMRPPRPLPL